MLKRTKQIITAILATATIASSAIPVFASTYSDVSDSHWANSYINKITGLGAFSGYEDGTFRPDNVITYQEFTKTVVGLILNPLEDKIEPVEDGYEIYKFTPAVLSGKEPYDADYRWHHAWDDWAQPYLNFALDKGLIKYDNSIMDTEDYNFGGPRDEMSRFDMAKLIARTMDYLGEEKIENTDVYKTALKDYDYIPNEYKDYVLQAYGKGVLSGYEDGSFHGDRKLTRAEASSVLVRLVDQSMRETKGKRTYMYQGKEITWTSPIRDDVPKEYQVSMSDLFCMSNYVDGIKEGVVDVEHCLNNSKLSSKVIKLEDVVLQSFTFDEATKQATFTIPDLLPDCWQFVVNKVRYSEPGEYTIDTTGHEKVRITVLPKEVDNQDRSSTYSIDVYVNGAPEYHDGFYDQEYMKGKIAFHYESGDDEYDWQPGKSFIDYKNEFGTNMTDEEYQMIFG